VEICGCFSIRRGPEAIYQRAAGVVLVGLRPMQVIFLQHATTTKFSLPS